MACIWSTHHYESLSTLRFASRMKCIENKPLRNSTLAAKHDSNPQLLQIIENLKRELALRDTIHSMAYLGIRGGVAQGEGGSGGEGEKIEQVYYPTLTVNQKKATVQLVGDILRSGKGVEKGVPSPALKVNSLSQLSFLTEIMSQIVWEACENDAERVNYVYNKVVRGGGGEEERGSGDIAVTAESVLERVDSHVENDVDYHGYHQEEVEEVEAEPRGITPPPTDLLRASTPPPSALNIKLTFEQYIVTDAGTVTSTHSLT